MVRLELGGCDERGVRADVGLRLVDKLVPPVAIPAGVRLAAEQAFVKSDNVVAGRPLAEVVLMDDELVRQRGGVGEAGDVGTERSSGLRFHRAV